MKRELSLLIAAVLFTAAAPLAAHHSFSATYFEDKSASLEGQVVEFAFRNPHSYVILETPGERRARPFAGRSSGPRSGR